MIGYIPPGLEEGYEEGQRLEEGPGRRPDLAVFRGSNAPQLPHEVAPQVGPLRFADDI